jgi:hypothetical protein
MDHGGSCGLAHRLLVAENLTYGLGTSSVTVWRERVDLVTTADRGAGVVELVRLLEADDLDWILPRLSRHQLRLGTDSSDRPVGISRMRDFPFQDYPISAGSTAE